MSNRILPNRRTKSCQIAEKCAMSPKTVLQTQKNFEYVTLKKPNSTSEWAILLDIRINQFFKELCFADFGMPFFTFFKRQIGILA